MAQNSFDNFFKPSDSLNKKRQNSVFVTEAVLASGALIGLNQLWYADYPKSDFHFINDNSEWMQMDKLGHLYSSYQIGRFGAETLNWSGVNKKNQLIYGASLGFVFLTAVEVMDGFSAEWGASMGDVVANAAGTALYVSQELIWKEQRIVPKFSYHKTKYSDYRPDLLGSTTQEQILKDYNGQTYWFSANLHSFAKKSKIPKWLNLALGYGAEGMIGENEGINPLIFLSKPLKFRQFYLSLDLDLTKINSKSHFLKTIFSVLNTVKIPAPTLEYSPQQGFKFYALYF
ncbi:Predicted lipoprotein [Flavobacterium fluvii]|uniref:Predicted lipoprotein n=1 Tax=Flavobacterium fluvii TaxID=468056 RepID=A0A1M5K672_9FLAO|nr:Predicted lipoprotein [Flavobacterium fluvii]